MCESVCGGTHMSIVSECRSVRMLVCCELVSVSVGASVRVTGGLNAFVSVRVCV